MAIALGLDVDWASPSGWAIAENPGDRIVRAGTIMPVKYKGKVTDAVQQARMAHLVRELEKVVSYVPMDTPVFVETPRTWMMGKIRNPGSNERRPATGASVFSAAYAQAAAWMATQGRQIYSVDPNRIRRAFGVQSLMSMYGPGKLFESEYSYAMIMYGDAVKAKVCLSLAVAQQQAHGGVLRDWLPRTDHEGDAMMIALVGADFASRRREAELI